MQKKFDFETIFPEHGDPRRPPDWLWRAIVQIIIAVFIAIGVFSIWEQIHAIVAVIIMSFFFGFALEPIVLKLNKFGVNRSVGAALTILIILGGFIAAFVALGNVFIQQLVELLQHIPDMYKEVQSWIQEQFGIYIPSSTDMLSKTLNMYASEISGNVISFSTGLFNSLLYICTAIMMIYYLCARGLEFRKSVITWFKPTRQEDIIKIITIAQNKISGYLGSRLILALFSTIATSICLAILEIPFWLPVGLFMGLVSQFVPTIGTYLGGALPVVLALTSSGMTACIIVLIFLVVYQQIENFIFSPKISEGALDLNPAVSFLCVLLGVTIFGPIGAFIALPVVATIVAVIQLSTKRYDLIDVAEFSEDYKQHHKRLKKQARNTKKVT